MTFEVDVNGRARIVSVERTGSAGHYRVTVEGRVHVVNAMRVGQFGLSLIERGTATSSVAEPLVPVAAPLSREVHVVPGSARGELLITLDGRTVPASVNARRTGRGAADSGSHAPGEQTVVAPMPGRIVRVLVEPGDEVTVRQGVIVVEAMKMENELRSPKAGRVKEVAVSAGTSVEAGRTLVVIE